MSYFQAGWPTSPTQTGQIMFDPFSSVRSGPGMPSHLRPLQKVFPPSQAQGSHLRILQATPVSSLLNTSWSILNRPYMLGLNSFPFAPCNLFLQHLSEEKPIPTRWLKALGSSSAPGPANSDRLAKAEPSSPARHTGSCSSWRPLSNGEGGKKADLHLSKYLL